MSGRIGRFRLTISPRAFGLFLAAVLGLICWALAAWSVR